ncbi:MAG: hypothetical protein UX35_C0002G0019 [Microgenomates group bacterium GW2011_GWA1_46_15]|nr:MAG: hypothetical protein UX00_C0010G0004 [Microgenomates group bacterium GW2011_GWB1_45_17]KKU23566.1 MAG: hypothetical protein UX36_C0004G0019 [Microgenomates group bacterium GW2011_GWC1_46_15]KKU24285.1 MAG: hypothetical protein UX35_C0002G0019 [Microgenomates group bacterium GW2011_GWA1_46_15]
MKQCAVFMREQLEKELQKLAKQRVQFSRFFISANDHALGANMRFNGELPCPLPETYDEDTREEHDVWACGMYSIFTILRYFRLPVTLSEVMERTKEYGADHEGTPEHTTIDTYAHFGITAVPVRVSSIQEIKAYTDQGCVFVANVIALWENQIADGTQLGDGHWLPIFAGDKYNNLLVGDPSYRSPMHKGPTFGARVLTEKAYWKIAYEFNGAVHQAEHSVLPGAEWYGMEGIAVYPPHMKPYVIK